MDLSLRRWKPGQLLLGWAAYWAALVGIGLGPAIRASWRATRLPEGHGTISAGFGDKNLTYSVIEDGVKTIDGSIPMTTVLLWVVGPPLLLWLVWLLVRQRPAERDRAVASGAANDALPAGSSPAAEWGSNRDDGVPVERAEVRTPNP